MKFNSKAFGDELAGVIAAELRPLLADIKALRERCEALEARLSAPPPTADEIQKMIEQAVKALPPAPPGKDGTSVTLADVAPLIEQAVKALPPAPPGKDGTSVTLADVAPLIEQAVKALPPAAPGKDGTSVTLADVAPLIEQAVKALPPAAPGKDGTSVTLADVAPLIEQAVKALPPAPPGKDGVGVAGAMIDREDCLLLTLTNGEVKNLGRVVGKDGASFDEFSMEFDAEASEVVIKARSGDVAKEVRAPIRGITLGGYWRGGTRAKAQEAWSHGGCLWVAKRDTSSKPDATSEDWILAARKGRDGEGVERAAPTTGPVKLGA